MKKNNTWFLAAMTAPLLLFIQTANADNSLIDPTRSNESAKTEEITGFCKLRDDISPQEYLEIVSYADKLGWVKKDELPENLKQKASVRCDGFYVERGINAKHNRNAAINIEADSVSGSVDEEISLFDGNVIITQENSQTYSESACFDQLKNRAALYETVQIETSGLRMLGDQATFDLTKYQGQIHNSLFAVADAHIRGQSNQMDFDFEGTKQFVVMDDGYITFCEPTSNAWKLDAEDIELDFEEGWGQASHINVQIQDVPVLYIPWMNFPLDDRRKTGFLHPSFEIKDGENAISTPFYWNIAPNYDATITPRYFENRGEMLEGEFRYLNEWGMNTLSGGYLADDKDYPSEDDIDTLGESAGEDRWAIHYDHLGKIDDWKTEIDYNRVSDDDYRSDFGGLLSRSTDGTVDQLARATWSGESLFFTTQMRSYQITDKNEVEADQYKLLPDATLFGSWSDFGAWQPSIYLQTSYFDRIGDASNLNNTERTTTVGSAFRISSQVTLDYDQRKTWGYLTPGATLYSTHYQINSFDDEYFDSKADTSLPAFHLKGGLYFDRPFRFMETGYLQTLEPQFMYTYIPYQNQDEIPVFDAEDADLNYSQLFKPNRFNGRDRVGDTSQVSLGLTSRLLNDDGYQSIMARAGTIVYLKDRKVDLTNDHDRVKENTENDYDTSNYIGEVRYSPTQDWSYQFDLEWSDRLNQTERSSHGILYRPDNDHVATLRYNEKKEDFDDREEFLEFSAGWRVSNFWSVFHRTEYDLTLDRTSDILNGFEYNNCCWRASVVYRRYYTGDQELVTSNGTNTLRDEFDSGLFFLFELKGLAGTGGSTDALLSELIEGINQRTIYDY